MKHKSSEMLARVKSDKRKVVMDPDDPDFFPETEVYVWEHGTDYILLGPKGAGYDVEIPEFLKVSA